MKPELMLGYDKEVDVLYLSFGEPQKGMEYVDIAPDLIARIDPKTRKLVGLTIIDFEKHFADGQILTHLPVIGDLEIAGAK
jgi:uncharacterized protein YuzE